MNYQDQINSSYYLARLNEILLNMQNEMLITKTTGNITIDFIRCMIPRNTAVIYMCQNLFKYSKYSKLYVNNIVNTEEYQINIMNEIMKSTPYYQNSQRSINSYFKRYFKIVNNMINNIRNSSVSADINLNFIYEMIILNEGAIKMCQNVIRYQIDPRLRNFSSTIILDCNNQISMLRELENQIIKKYP